MLFGLTRRAEPEREGFHSRSSCLQQGEQESANHQGTGGSWANERNAVTLSPGVSTDVGGQSNESAQSPDGRLFLDILDGGSKGLWRRNRDATLPEYGSNAVGQSHAWQRLGRTAQPRRSLRSCKLDPIGDRGRALRRFACDTHHGAVYGR